MNKIYPYACLLKYVRSYKESLFRSIYQEIIITNHLYNNLL